MKCPACPEIALVLSDRHGVEIDYCPKCRGVWLDRGELDKLIERAPAMEQPEQHQISARSRPDFVDSDHDGVRGHHARRRKSWLSEIFD